MDAVMEQDVIQAHCLSGSLTVPMPIDSPNWDAVETLIEDVIDGMYERAYGGINRPSSR